MLPSALGNSGPPCRLGLTIAPGPRRAVDDCDRPRLYIPAAGRVRKARPPGLARCGKILVVKLDFIGDWIMTIPFLEALRQNAPHAEITVVVLDRVFEFAETCRFADRAVSVARADGRRIVFGAMDGATLAGFRRDYAGGHFDLALVPRYDADFNGALAIAHGSGAPAVVGFSEKTTPRKRLLNRGDDRFYSFTLTDPRLVAHEAARGARLIEALGGTFTATGPTLDLLTEDEQAATQFLRGEGLATGGFLAVAPFGSEAKRTLPSEILGPVVTELARRASLDVVVVASPGDFAKADRFASQIGGHSTAGALGLRATAALLRRARAFVGMDSGPAHMAAAVGIPVAVIAAHPATGSPAHAGAPERFAPLGAPGQVTIIRPSVAAAPCRDGCDAREAHCILGVTPVLLQRTVSALLRLAPDPAAKSRSRQRRPSVMDAHV